MHLPRLRGHRLLRSVAIVKSLVPAAGLGGIALGFAVRGPGVGESVFALLVLSAVLVAVVQQTLP